MFVTDENLVITGDSVTLYGDVNGDVIAACSIYNQYGSVFDNLFAAARTVDIAGPVMGDIIAFGQTVNVRSDTANDVRGAAQTFNMFGYIDGDVLAAAQTVHLADGAAVTGDFVVGAGDVTLFGDVMGDVKIGSESLVIAGTIHGNADLWCDDIQFTGDGRVLGELNYHDDEEHDIAFGDHVVGKVDFDKIIDDDDNGGSWTWLWLLITAIVSSLLIVLVWRNGAVGSANALVNKTGMSILLGFVAVAAIPIVAIILLVLLVTIPAGIILLLIYPVLLYIGWIMFGIWLGKFLFDLILKKDTSLWLAAPVGVLILGLLSWIPFIGWLIAVCTMIVGAGMLVLQLYAMRGARMEKKAIPQPGY